MKPIWHSLLSLEKRVILKDTTFLSSPLAQGEAAYTDTLRELMAASGDSQA